MRVKCGKCSTRGEPVYHSSSEQVRRCYSGAFDSHDASDPSPSQHGMDEQGVPIGPGGHEVKPENPARMKWDIPEGHYAVTMPDDKLHFFQVQKPADGKWEGWTFVKEQASDEKHPVKGRRMLTVLQLISEDWEAAMLAYGKNIGRCGHCNRTLTDEDSRRLGIGPVCLRKMGSLRF